MEQQRNLLLAVVLSVMVLIGWQIFVEGPRIEERNRIVEEQAAQQAANVDPEQSALDSGLASNSVAPANGLPASTHEEQATSSGTPIPFETKAITGSFNTLGARLDEVVLRHYRETLEDDSENIKLLQPYQAEKPYFVDYGWKLASSSNRQGLTPQTEWQMVSQNSNRVVMETSLDGLLYRVIFAFGDDDYLVNVSQEVSNQSDQAVRLRPYGRVVRFGEQEGSSFFILHEGLIGYFSEDHLEEITYSNLADADNGTMQYASKGGWAGITDKYWLTALLPSQSDQLEFTFNQGQALGQPFNQSLFQAAFTTLNPGQSRAYDSNLFVGAKEVNLLDEYAARFNIEHFDKAVDFGWFYYLTKPFFKLLSIINSYVGNFGVAILVLTLLIKLLLFPLANASYRSMSKMKLLQPKITELRERYGDDRAKLQQETMKFYKEEGVNPLGGCLPIVVQIPIFFSLYKVLFVTIEMRHAPFFGWVHDLSAKDPTSIFNLFGLLPFDPNAGALVLLSFLSIGIWPIIMGLTMWIQQKLNPAPSDPMQAKIMMFLPIIFTFILAPFPAGLVIYWTWNNILSVAQQWFIMRNTKLEKIKVREPKKKEKST